MRNAVVSLNKKKFGAHLHDDKARYGRKINIQRKKKSDAKRNLSYDNAAIQCIMSCHKIIHWRVDVTSLRTSVSTMRILL